MMSLAELFSVLAGLVATYAAILWIMRHSGWQPDKNQTIVAVIKAACAIAIAAGAYVVTDSSNPEGRSHSNHQVGR
ncbi:MAG: hypothetical protein WC100_05970 [Sterolibacterium sp.]